MLAIRGSTGGSVRVTTDNSVELTGIQPLFASPLLSFNVPNADALNAGLLAEIGARRAAEPSIYRSNRGGWHSADDVFRRTEPAHQRLARQIIGAVRTATLTLQPAAQVNALRLEAEGWVNVNPPGALNAPHDHPGWLWSGCYYVQVPAAGEGSTPTDGCIEFINSRTNLRAGPSIDIPFMRSQVVVQPLAGQLLLFPSHLLHWVCPHVGPGDRVSVAFNARWMRD
jgi:uncharacterized protein (TIGR02466 family)